MNETIRHYMATLGMRGGKATGAAKRRPPEHYAKLAELKKAEAKARREQALAEALAYAARVEAEREKTGQVPDGDNQS